MNIYKIIDRVELLINKRFDELENRLSGIEAKIKKPTVKKK